MQSLSYKSQNSKITLKSFFSCILFFTVLIIYYDSEESIDNHLLEINEKWLKKSIQRLSHSRSFIAAGGIGIHKAMDPGPGGVEEEFEPTGG